MNPTPPERDDPYAAKDFENAGDLVRKRQFFPRRPKKASQLMAQLMARKGYGQQRSAGELDEVWNLIADEKWRDQTRVGNVRQGVLEVIVSTSVLNQRLEFDKKRLLRELKKHLPQTNLKDIRFRIGNV